MEKIVDYMTVTTTGNKEFDKTVKTYIGKGWIPFGGVSVSAYITNNIVLTIFSQALIKV